MEPLRLLPANLGLGNIRRVGPHPALRALFDLGVLADAECFAAYQREDRFVPAIGTGAPLLQKRRWEALQDEIDEQTWNGIPGLGRLADVFLYEDETAVRDRLPNVGLVNDRMAEDEP
jgi:hypothetical protein